MNILHNGAIALYHGDCLDVMHEIPDGSVDAIICDLPYGTTDCKWDSVIPFEPMWAALKRIIKPRGAIVLFGSQPFTSTLIVSNLKWFKYEWIWKKNRGSGHLNAKRIPMKYHENILVFYQNGATYNPIAEEYSENTKRRWDAGGINTPKNGISGTTVYGGSSKNPSRVVLNPNGRSPSSVQEFKTVTTLNEEKRIHSTQKPVALLEYLIRTYTNEGETVLDFTSGSCTAGVAALTTKRRFIGIERDAVYYALGVQRVQSAIDNLPPMDV